MGEVDLFKIYNIMMILYKCTKFELVSTRNNVTKKPQDIVVEFYIEKKYKVNIKRLHRQLEKHICVVQNYYLIADEGKVTLLVEFIDTHKKFKPSLNFCLN